MGGRGVEMREWRVEGGEHGKRGVEDSIHTLLPIASTTSSSWLDLSARRGPDP